jgi:thiol-disulfide isomerase/thioredoxin
MIKLLLHRDACLIFLLPILLGLADSHSLSAAETRCAVLEVFLKGDADHSRTARQFVEKTYTKHSGLIIAYRDVEANDRHLNRYWDMVDHFKIEKPKLPAFLVSSRVEMGWDPAGTPNRLAEALSVEVFVRDGCAHCQAAHPVLFEQLASNYPGYRFVELNLGTSPDAARRLQELSQRYRVLATSVPAVHMCGRLMVGCLDAETGFRQWDTVLRNVTVPCTVVKAATAPHMDRQVQRAGTFTGSIWQGSTVLAAEPGTPKSQKDSPKPRPAVPVAEDTHQKDAVTDGAPPPRRPFPKGTQEFTDLIKLPPLQHHKGPDTVTLPFIGEVRWKDWGLPAFTVLVGLVDGFNPCAMWVLLFLLSLLVNLRDRRKILAVAGTFVVISGLAYLAFMAAWLNVFQLIGLLRPAQVILGLIGVGVGTIHIKDYFAFKQGVSLSIPESVKPGLYDRMRRIVQAETLCSAILGASVLAILVNVVELLCTAGLPAMYTGVLTLQNLTPWQNYAYLLLYIAAYMLDDALMVTVVVVTLGRHKLQERGGRILKLISGVVILVLGTIMLLRPDWLV